MDELRVSFGGEVLNACEMVNIHAMDLKLVLVCLEAWHSF
jgi:hypothetical protein